MVKLAFAIAELDWRDKRSVVVPVCLVEVTDDKARHELGHGFIGMVRFDFIGSIATNKVKDGQLTTGMFGEPSIELVDLSSMQNQRLAIGNALCQLCTSESAWLTSRPGTSGGGGRRSHAG